MQLESELKITYVDKTNSTNKKVYKKRQSQTVFLLKMENTRNFWKGFIEIVLEWGPIVKEIRNNLKLSFS
jgi:hypothetical protein